MIEVISESTPTANKEHRCNYCGGIIQKGERYNRRTLKFDGAIYEWKSHVDCQMVADQIANDDYEGWCCEEGIDQETFEEAVMYDYAQAGVGACTSCPYYQNDCFCSGNRSFKYCLPYVIEYFKRTKCRNPKP